MVISIIFISYYQRRNKENKKININRNEGNN